uniref:Putative conserved secreted protein n=1 Tax=Rhipicephalus microplus TaxID=6941 RepID=A0A6M2CWG9_RHIMP
MLLPSIIFLCFILQHCIGENSSQSDAVTTEIGKGVEAKVYILYDTEDYATKYTHHKHPKMSAVWYFIRLFENVQSYFHRRNVKVLFSVIGVDLNKTVWVKTNHSIDTNATLKNLQQALPTGYIRPNKTIVYLFTNNTLPITGSTDTATFGTFCTPNVSAAIVVQPPGNTSYTSTVKATSLIFGASGTVNFTTEDIDTMNKTFSNCKRKRRKTTTTEITTETTTLPTSVVMINTTMS